MGALDERTRRKSPRQRKQEELANEWVSAAEYPHAWRRNKPRKRALEHRRERRQVAEELRAVGARRTDPDEAAHRVRSVKPMVLPWGMNEPLGAHLEGTRVGRLRRELETALADPSVTVRRRRVIAVLEGVMRPRHRAAAMPSRHRRPLVAELLNEWLWWREGDRTRSLGPPSLDRLRDVLAHAGDLEVRLRAWILGSGVKLLPRRGEVPPVPAEPAPRIQRRLPSWEELAEAQAPARRPRTSAEWRQAVAFAVEELRRMSSAAQAIGTPYRYGGGDLWVRLRDGREHVVTGAFAHWLAARVHEDASALLARRLTAAERDHLTSLASVREARALLSRLAAHDPSDRDRAMASELARSRGEAAPRRKREATRGRTPSAAQRTPARRAR